MSTATKNAVSKKPLAEMRGKSPLRRQPISEAELPPEAQELRRQFREWRESFATPAKRMAYIKKLCQRIAEAFHPEKIVLFGSHAYGKPTPESDVDLLIVMNYEGPPLDQSRKIRTALQLCTPMDLLVRAPVEIEGRLKDGDMFIVQIMEDGKVMYEAQHE